MVRDLRGVIERQKAFPRDNPVYQLLADADCLL
jgi:hypothetical protein